MNPASDDTFGSLGTEHDAGATGGLRSLTGQFQTVANQLSEEESRRSSSEPPDVWRSHSL